MFFFLFMVAVLVNDINRGFHNRLEPIIERWAELTQALFGYTRLKFGRRLKARAEMRHYACIVEMH